MNKFSAKLLAFAGSNTQVYEQFLDLYNHYRSQNDKSGKVFTFQTTRKVGDKEVAISFSQKEDLMNQALKKEIMRVANIGDMQDFPLETWASHPTLRWATFAVINQMIDMILPETIIDSVGMYTDVKVGDWGDSFAFDVAPRDLFAVYKAGKGMRQAEIHKQFKGQVTVLPEMRELTVGVSLYRVLAGKESLAEFAMKAVRSLETAMATDVFNTFNTAMAALPTTPTDGELRFAGYSQNNLVKLGQRVTAWNGGAKAILVGTQLAMQNVLPADANYRYMIDSEFVKLGYVRTAFGYDTLILPQVADYSTPFKLLLDDKKIYVLSTGAQKIVKLCLEGSTLSNVDAPYANANLTQQSTLYKSWGAAVATNAAAGVITLP